MLIKSTVGRCSSEMSIDSESLEDSKNGFLANTDVACPQRLITLASTPNPKTFVFVRALGEFTLQTARCAISSRLVKPILVGEPELIARDAASIGWDLRGAEIVPAEGEKESIEVAIKLFKSGRAAGLVKGQLHTDIFMSEVVKRDSGIRKGKRLIHLFAMFSSRGGRPLFISDAAVNVAPDVATRVDASLLMAELARRLGRSKPKIAILSATETVIDSIPSSFEAANVAIQAAKLDELADFAGPLSFDLAVSPIAAAVKGFEGPVAGVADGLVVPDLESGNILFKSLVWCSGALAAGLVLGGAIPMVLTSRSDNVASRLASLALSVIAGR